MITSVLLFIVGLGLLIKGADFLVEGAASLAKRLHISNIVIGLTVVAFGTSMPELVVNLFSAVQGTTDIAIGNILGSNIANILLILGISAIIFPLTVQKNTTWKEIPLSLLAALVVWVVGNDVFLDHGAVSQITRSEGMIMVFFFIIFLYYTVGIAKVEGEGQEVRVFGLAQSILFVLGGLALLILGGKWVVDGAVLIARTFGISETLIGLTIVAVGTSLPELATSAVAAYKHHADIAVGNIVGSNIFNVFLILGITAFIRPLPMVGAMNIDIGMTITASLFLFLAMFVGRRHTLERWQGVVFLVIYFAYIGYLVVRG